MLSCMNSRTIQSSNDRYYATAYLLAIVTIFYNLAEGMVSIWFGCADRTLTLFGFGVDSLVEVVSGIGVWHMIRRIRTFPEASPDTFEKLALRITGGSLYALTAGLLMSAGLGLHRHHRPETTFRGIVIGVIAIVSMWLLTRYKLKVGKLLRSKAIIADAACSKVCLYLSLILLGTSLAYQFTGIGSLDAAGTILIAYFSWKEGKEAFQKARGMACCCRDGCP